MYKRSVIPKCCYNSAKFLIEYQIGSKYLVCEDCEKDPHWQRGISSKKILKEGAMNLI